MKEQIIHNIDNPNQLEQLYRANKSQFKISFNDLYPEIKGYACAPIWFERLNFIEKNDVASNSKGLMSVVLLSLLAAFLAKIPNIFSIDTEFYYTRNIGFIVFPILAIFFALNQKFSAQQLIGGGIVIVFSVFYINFLPDNKNSDTLALACIHLPIILWFIAGIAFVGKNVNDYMRRLEFLRFNGDLLVMMAILLISGGILSAITIGLFSLINMNIEEFYRDYIVVFGLAAIPVFATLLVQVIPQLVNKVSPVIAVIFAPLVLIMLLFYLAAIVYSGKDPYNDREFLMIFNFLLVGVMAIIFFSIAETTKSSYAKFTIPILLALSIITLVVNGIALSAIVFRINEWGITPNRLTVLGSNMLVMVNLLFVSFRLFKTVIQKQEISAIQKSIAIFLPFYLMWAILVVFIFPVIFQFN